MANIYKNITGNTAIKIAKYKTDYNTISLCNVHASGGVNVDLYLHREEGYNTYSYDEDGRREDGSYDAPTITTYIYYILKNVNIPNGVTLLLDKDILSFDAKKYRLYIKLSASDSAVDLVSNTTNINENNY